MPCLAHAVDLFELIHRPIDLELLPDQPRGVRRQAGGPGGGTGRGAHHFEKGVLRLLCAGLRDLQKNRCISNFK